MLLDKKIHPSLQKIYSYDSLSAILFGLFNALVINFVPVLMRKNGATDFVMGLISISQTAGSFLIFLWLNLALKSEKFRFIGITKAIGRAILFLPLFTKNPLFYAIAIFIYYIFEQGSSSTYVSVMNDIYPHQYRGFTMGMVRIEGSVAIILVSLIAGRMFDLYDFRILFSIGITLGILSAYTFYRIKNITTINSIPRTKGKFKLSGLITLLKKDKLIVKYFSIFFMLGFGNLINAAVYPIFLVDILHISNTLFGIALSLQNIALIFGFYLWGKYIDKKGPLLTRVILCFIFFCIPLFFVLMYLFQNLYIIFLFIPFILRGLVFSGGELSRVNFIIRVVNKKDIEKYWTIDYFLLGTRGFVAPYLGILLKNLFGFLFVFILSLILIGLAAILMYMYYKNNYKELSKRNAIS